MENNKEKKLKKIRIINWKSFKDCTIELNEGLNILVGPNASGKTNLLEAFKFLKKAIGKPTTPYAPHLEWWNVRNIAYKNDTTKPITFELHFTNGITYKVSFSIAGGALDVFEEELSHNGFQVRRRNGIIRVYGEFSSDKKIIIRRLVYKIKKFTRISFLDHAEIYHGEFGWIFRYVKDFISSILFVKHVNVNATREPVPVVGVDEVAEDGRNLAQLLHRLFLTNNGKYPDIVEHALRNLFPELSLKFDLTPDGRVFMKVLDNKLGAEIYPPCISDGFYKILHLTCALNSDFSILLVDEVENSLHFEALEYVISEFKNSGRQILVATHSPVVVDVAGIEPLLLFEATAEGSVAKRVANVDRVREWMREKGLTPSEMWEYGLQ